MWFDERHIRKGSRKGNKSLSLFVVSAGVLNKMYAKITRYAAILFSTRPLGSALLQTFCLLLVPTMCLRPTYYAMQ